VVIYYSATKQVCLSERANAVACVCVHTFGTVFNFIFHAELKANYTRMPGTCEFEFESEAEARSPRPVSPLPEKNRVN